MSNRNELKTLKEYIYNLEIALYLVSKDCLSHQSIFQLLSKNIDIHTKSETLHKILIMAKEFGCIEKYHIAKIKKLRELNFNNDLDFN